MRRLGIVLVSLALAGCAQGQTYTTTTPSYAPPSAGYDYAPPPDPGAYDGATTSPDTTTAPDPSTPDSTTTPDPSAAPDSTTTPDVTTPDPTDPTASPDSSTTPDPATSQPQYSP